MWFALSQGQIEILWRLLLRLRKLRSHIDFLSEIVHLLIDLADLRRDVFECARYALFRAAVWIRYKRRYSPTILLFGHPDAPSILMLKFQFYPS